MRFDTKIAIVVRGDLETWRKLNVTAFLASAVAAAHRRALTRDLPTAVYTEELFATDNDDDNRAAVRAVPADELNLVGLAVHGPRNAVDKVCKGLVLHP